jgi:hypothetical protein
MKTKSVLFTSILFVFFSSYVIASAQGKVDTVGVIYSPVQIDSNLVVISATVIPNENSATTYFELTSDHRTFEMRSFSDNDDGSVSFAFRIMGLRPNTTYELKFVAFKNDDSKELCGQKIIKFTTEPGSKFASSDGKKKRNWLSRIFRS